MNRRRLLRLALGSAAALSQFAAMARSTPIATPDIPDVNRHLYSPEAASVHAMTFRRDQSGTEDTIRFHYTLFVFPSNESATANFDEIADRVAILRDEDNEFAKEWDTEADIGTIGDDRLGYFTEDKARLNGLAVAGEIMVAFKLVTIDPASSYENIIQGVLEDSPSLDLDLGDFPPGWRYEIEPREVTEYFQ